MTKSENPLNERVLFVTPDGEYIPFSQMMQKQTDAGGVVRVEDLEEGSVVEVVTRNSTYFLTLIDPKERTATITGGLRRDKDSGEIIGERYPEPTKVFISGSTWGGSMLWMGQIGADLILELVEEESGKLLHTSWIDTIFIRKPV